MLKIPDDLSDGRLDDYFMEILLNPPVSSNISVYLIKNYSRSYPNKFREFILKYILLSLTEEIGLFPNDPKEIVNLINDPLNEDYEKNIDCITELSKIPGMLKVLMYSIYEIGFSMSRTDVENLNFSGLKFLLSLPCVQKELEKPLYWGLVTEKYGLRPNIHYLNGLEIQDEDQTQQKSYSNQHIINSNEINNKKEFVLEGNLEINSNTERNITANLDIRNQVLNFNKESSSIFSYTKDTNFLDSETKDILDYVNRFIKPYRAYLQDSMLPFFLEGALEPFVYRNNASYSHMFFDVPQTKLRGYVDAIYREMFLLAKTLYGIILNLVSKRQKCKTFFLGYIRKCYIDNLNRRKIMFSRKECASDGFFVNFSNVIDLFCEKIVQNRLYDKIDIGYFNKITSAADSVSEAKTSESNLSQVESKIENLKIKIPGDMNTYQVNKEFNELVTTVFTYNILYFNLGWSKVMELYEYLNIRSYREEERFKKLTDSLLNAQCVLFLGAIFKDKIDFFNFAVVLASKVDSSEDGEHLENNYNKKNKKDNTQNDIGDNFSVGNNAVEYNLAKPESFINERSDFEEENCKEKFFFSPEYYESIIEYTKISIKFFIHTLPANTLTLILKMIKTDNNIHNNQRLLEIIVDEQLSLTKEHFLSLCKIYDKSRKADEVTKEKIRLLINRIIKKDKNLNIKKMKEEGIKYVCAVIQDLEGLLSLSLDCIIKLKTLNTKLEELKNKKDSKNTVRPISERGTFITDTNNIYQSEPHNITSGNTRNPSTLISQENTNNALQTQSSSLNSQNMTREETLISYALNLLRERNGQHEEEVNDSEGSEIANLELEIKKTSDNAYYGFKFVAETFDIILTIIILNKKMFEYPATLSLLINTLNYNLKLLVGPRCTSFSIKNMEKYNFRPKEILKCLIKIYIRIDDTEALTKGRDFNLKFFNRAIRICSEKKLLSLDEIVKFEKLISECEYLLQNKPQDQLDILKEIPDDYFDPLTCEIMKNPVRLLTSNKVVDKSTFDMIMIGDCIDPFNRESIDETKIVYETKLKEQINEYIRQNLNKNEG
ncbi:hypothetical protein EDEG_01824 [Edhazardia aedis USNM 41457]|uniref:U-box domain-containing protein n=1 Tax=Edhazardia aedis (strain USNM 41457) TaxID=1003232 RepID=J9DRC1_EDHAE|nr:hypothetical protein EDEG_01824 [Edhazardia aedis USNM 41457]|eukprot:EJW03887.1 hypothetical protein EDEG_01824 [Edhazardia aedis USNM 41457]